MNHIGCMFDNFYLCSRDIDIILKLDIGFRKFIFIHFYHLLPAKSIAEGATRAEGKERA
jgi:hypothetical protein